MQNTATAEKEVSYQSTFLLNTYQKRFRMPGGSGKLLEPLCKIYGLSSICVAVGLDSVFLKKNGSELDTVPRRSAARRTTLPT